MNIGLFSDTYIPEINGVATSVNSLYKILKKYGHNVYVITTSDKKEVTFENDIIRIPGVELKKLYGYRMAFVFNSKAFKIIKNLHLDVVHVNTEFGIGKFGFIVASRLKIASVYTYHTMYEDYTYYMTKGYFDRVSKWVIREFCKTNMVRANEIITPSEKTKVYLRSIGIESYINVVPTGFDISGFANIDKNCEYLQTFKEKYKLSDKSKILLCLGRLAKEKSFDIVIDGYKQFKETFNYDTKLLFVGDGPAASSLKRQAERLGLKDDVIFVGKVPQKETKYFYALADVFLNASVSETQGLTFMEAMAGGDIILCRFDNNLIGIINNKINGFFFIDADDFKYKLKEILELEEEKKKEILDNALKSIDGFGENSFYNNIIEVYTRAIRRNW